MPPLVSILVVTFNGEKVIGDCLDSLREQSLGDFEIIVVDNASSDRTAEKVKDSGLPGLALIPAPRNLGFAEGNNLAFQNSRGAYLALLNQDARAGRGWLQALVRAAESRPRAGMVAAKVLRPGSPPVLDSTGLSIYPDGLNRTRGGGEPDRGQYDRAEEVFAPSGSAALYRREMLTETGFFDPGCFLYGDDIDLGFRGRLKGWTCLYSPEAVAYHPHSDRPRPPLRDKIFHVERNRLRLALRYFPLSFLLAGFFLHTPKRYVFQGLSYRRKRGPAGDFRAAGGAFSDLFSLTLKAHLSVIRELPGLARERRRWRKERRAASALFPLWFERFGISARNLAFQE